jgi:upstream activation factor subunit UAF30
MSPPPKKRKKLDSDAKLAAKLQAEENSRARPSRNGVNKKPVAARKKSTPKKKSAAKIKADDDSDLELNSDGEKKEVVRKGGFHVSQHPPQARSI